MRFRRRRRDWFRSRASIRSFYRRDAEDTPRKVKTSTTGDTEVHRGNTEFCGIFLGALGVSAIELSAGARGADASVPRMGAAATGRRFEAKMEMTATGKICQSGSLKVSYWEKQEVTRW